MATDKLSESMEVVLAWMAENTDAHPKAPRWPGSHSRASREEQEAQRDAWLDWSKTVMAGRTAFAREVQDGLGLKSRSYRGGANAAANTLLALRRRGLVEREEVGAYVAARWWITEAGAERARELEAAGHA